MTRIFFIAFTACAAFSFLAPRVLCASESPSVQWLMEDVLKEENIPLLQTNVITPGELSRAMEYYKAGNFRFASQVLEKLRDLNLPDGRLDFIYFALAECYRQLNLKSLALDAYQTVVRNFPDGPQT
ncbi:MAG TPA: tetratricopeptide repeat protein, partial [Chitinivibrionales bacterium]